MGVNWTHVVRYLRLVAQTDTLWTYKLYKARLWGLYIWISRYSREGGWRTSLEIPLPFVSWEDFLYNYFFTYAGPGYPLLFYPLLASKSVVLVIDRDRGVMKWCLQLAGPVFHHVQLSLIRGYLSVLLLLFSSNPSPLTTSQRSASFTSKVPFWTELN